MATQYDLFARFNFRGQPGTNQLNRTARAFQTLKRNAQSAKASVRKIGSGLQQLTIVSAGVGLAVGKIIKTTMDFNKQMSVVRSVTSISGKEFIKLRKLALKMGATTSFTAKQAADGMEALGRASLSSKQIMIALKPTLNMAAAESMNLGRAAEIVASSIKMFGLKAKDAQMVADTLAYTSAKANTNIEQLAEALKYGGTMAIGTNQSFKTLVGSLAVLANVGIRGSMAGTALKNAMVKLLKGSKAAYEVFGGKRGFNAVLRDARTNTIRPLNEIMAKTLIRLSKIKDITKRNALAFQIFGLRGKALADAFKAVGKVDLAKHFGDIQKNVDGMAERMAKIRLDNLAGDVTLLKSALSGVAIQLGSMLVPSLRQLISAGTGKGGMIGFLQKVAGALQMVNEGAKESAIVKKYGKTIGAVVTGIKQAIAGVKEAFIEVGKTVKSVFSKFSGGGKNTIKTIARIVTKGILFLTILGPIAVGLGTVAIAAGGAFKVISGGLGLIRLAFSPFGLAITAVMIALSAFKKKGESTFGFMHRIIKAITVALSPIISALKYMVKHVGVLGTVLGVGIAVKGGRMLLGGMLGKLGGGRGVMGRLGAIVGGAQPVYVTNWPIGMGGMGGIGGMAGRLGRAGAGAGAVGAAGAAGRVGWMARLAGIGAWGKGIAGVGALGGTGMKMAAVGMGGLAASIGMFFLGVKKLADAHSKEEQAKLRKKLAKEYAERTEAEKVRRAGGLIPYLVKTFSAELMAKTAKIQKTKKYGGELHPTVWMGEAVRKIVTGKAERPTLEYFESKVAPFLKQTHRLIVAGRGEEAREQLFKAGISQKEIAFLMKNLSEEGKKYYKFTPEMIKTLGNLNKTITEMRKTPIQVSVNIDGKQIASATAKTQQTTGERLGKAPAAGGKRRALRTGRP